MNTNMKNYLRDKLSRTVWACLGVVPLRAGRRRDLLALVVVLNLIPAGRAAAQTFTVLHSFTATSGTLSANSDGDHPVGLTLSGSALYGSARGGGGSGNGTLFAVHTDGTGFANLHSFTETDSLGRNSDGVGPNRLILEDGVLYGTAPYGGIHGYGTIFAVNTDGTGFTTMHSFAAAPYGTSSEGAYPNAGLMVSGDTLYGPAYLGGTSSVGTIFAINTDGTAFRNLHNFSWNDGAFPVNDLILA